jgi:hypothetical protein
MIAMIEDNAQAWEWVADMFGTKLFHSLRDIFLCHIQ